VCYKRIVSYNTHSQLVFPWYKKSTYKLFSFDAWGKNCQLQDQELILQFPCNNSHQTVNHIEKYQFFGEIEEAISTRKNKMKGRDGGACPVSP